ncbi:MAG: MFS transporter, partial [Novibacillus thermophilus]
MGRSPKVITAALFVSVHLALLDFGLVVPSLTSIVQEWNVSYSWVIQVITLYVLMLVVSVPFVTALSRCVGRQFTLTASLAVFGIGAVISGISPNFFTLLVGRLLQGVGG